MKALVLRLDAPLMSFGAVIVDQHGFIDRFPGTALVTGLCANALGWDHGDFYRLDLLQDRIRYAARWDVPARPIIDYQTVDLGQPKMLGYADRTQTGDPLGGWTTRGTPEHRDGGPGARFGTHQRYRHYWNDGLLTMVLTLTEGEEPTLEDLQDALRRPARPLFLGRKACLPSRPLLDPETPVVEGENLLTILRRVPVWNRAGTIVPGSPELVACWPAELGLGERGQVRRVFDRRNWARQIPAGVSHRAEGPLGEDEP